MTKFKVGDKVRVVQNISIAGKYVGDEGVIVRIIGGNTYQITSPLLYNFYEDELELELVTKEKTLDQHLEEAKNLVAELEQKIQDAKPKAADFDLGAVVVLEGDLGPDDGSTHTKAGRDHWVWSNRRNADTGASIVTDYEIDQYGIAEVLSEGI